MKRFARIGSIAAGCAAALAVGVAPAGAHTADRAKPTLLLHGVMNFDAFDLSQSVSPKVDCAATWSTMKAAFTKWGQTGATVRLGYFAGDENCDVSITDHGKHGHGSAANHSDSHGTTNGHPHSLSTDIRHLAYHLAWYIHDTYEAQDQPVDIVAHGIGGLIARVMLTEWRDNHDYPQDGPRVEDVVTLGTPHDGVQGAAALCTRWACQQMHLGSALLDELGADREDPLAAGPGAYPEGVGGTDWTVVGSAGDEIVSAQSATEMPFAHRIRSRNASLKHTDLLTQDGTERDASVTFVHDRGPDRSSTKAWRVLRRVDLALKYGPAPPTGAEAELPPEVCTASARRRPRSSPKARASTACSRFGYEKPVLYVHGIAPHGLGGNCNIWDTTEASLAASRLALQGHNNPLVHRDRNIAYYHNDSECDVQIANWGPNGGTYSETITPQTPIENVAYRLAWFIYHNYTASTSHTPTAVDIVAHSMGGLITRYAISRIGTAGWPPTLMVEDVVTYDTPHRGASPTSQLLCQLAVSVQCTVQMAPGSTFLTNLAASASNPQATGGTDWTAIAATGDALVLTTSQLGMSAAHKVLFHEPDIGHTSVYAESRHGSIDEAPYNVSSSHAGPPFTSSDTVKSWTPPVERAVQALFSPNQ